MHRTRQRIFYYLPLEYQVFSLFNQHFRLLRTFPYSISKTKHKFKRNCSYTTNVDSIFKNNYNIIKKKLPSSLHYKNSKKYCSGFNPKLNTIIKQKEHNEMSLSRSESEINKIMNTFGKHQSNTSNETSPIFLGDECEKIKRGMLILNTSLNDGRESAHETKSILADSCESVVMVPNNCDDTVFIGQYTSDSRNNTFQSNVASMGGSSSSAGSTSHVDNELLKNESQHNEIKIMSYNVLAQKLLQRHLNLYHKCDKESLVWEHRFNLIINEILAYNCDIICLQEIEETYLDYFTSKLSNTYKYIYKKRTGFNYDGCCIFYKTNKYSIVSYELVEYYKSQFSILNKHNVAIVIHFKYNNYSFIVANTHLLFNPSKSQVRHSQYQRLNQRIKSMISETGYKNIPVIITGDFNSKSDSSVVKHILQDYKCAYDLHSKYASTHHDYWCLVDYIFYTNKYLRLLNVKALPKSNEPLSRIPNKNDGSDHFSLVALFQFCG